MQTFTPTNLHEDTSVLIYAGNAAVFSKTSIGLKTALKTLAQY